MDKEKQDGNEERQEAKKAYRKSKEAARARAEYERLKRRIRGSRTEDFIDIEDWGY